MLRVSDPLFDLSGRIAVVTGGLGQMGALYTAGLAERGMRVAVVVGLVLSALPALAQSGGLTYTRASPRGPQPSGRIDAPIAYDAPGRRLLMFGGQDSAARNDLWAFSLDRQEWTEVIHPEDRPRFRELGVVANGQPLWAVSEGQMIHLTIPFLGPERSTWQYPFGSLVRSGAVLAFGSDWSVSSPDPFLQIHVAVNRRAPRTYAYGGESGEVFLPEAAPSTQKREIYNKCLPNLIPCCKQRSPQLQ
jgi:hypothetical protein